MSLPSRSAFRRLMPGLTLLVALSAGLPLAGCVSDSPYDALMQAKPSGSPFAQALFQDYSYLARSFGLAEAPSTTAFDASGSLSISDLDSDVANVADAYAQKALVAAKGEEPLPEAAPNHDRDAETARLKLLRALDEGRKAAPQAAARAQADYDCWVMNGAVEALAASAAQCRGAFQTSLAKLERALHPNAAPAAAGAKPIEFTAYFGLGSAALTDRDRAVLGQAIETARAGRQSRITVVGHTDTVGPEAFNRTLSKQRAEVVKAALVKMGARAVAVRTAGTGEEELAVQTADGVPNPQNRRAVVTLLP